MLKSREVGVCCVGLVLLVSFGVGVSAIGVSAIGFSFSMFRAATCVCVPRAESAINQVTVRVLIGKEGMHYEEEE